MLEVVRKYDIAGIQFDYMRFPSPDYCFCEHCKAQFQKDTGTKVEHWPEEVVRGGKYGPQYEQLAAGAADLAGRGDQRGGAPAQADRRAISLAAWPDTDVALHQVLQDWPTWVTQGALDFICYMTYTTRRGAPDRAGWRRTSNFVHGRIPVYAGLGAFLMKDPGPLIEQVQGEREAGADGFLAFAYYSGDLDTWLPGCTER